MSQLKKNTDQYLVATLSNDNISHSHLGRPFCLRLFSDFPEAVLLPATDTDVEPVVVTSMTPMTLVFR